jgi:NAD(P)-dependent dehydrogenase (short-subunit alcohol dehydrogenase family)
MTKELPDKVKDDVLSSTPAGRLGEPEEVADCVLFLAGEKSGFITGEVIRVDGGMAM